MDDKTKVLIAGFAAIAILVGAIFGIKAGIKSFQTNQRIEKIRQIQAEEKAEREKIIAENEKQQQELQLKVDELIQSGAKSGIVTLDNDESFQVKVGDDGAVDITPIGIKDNELEEVKIDDIDISQIQLRDDPVGEIELEPLPEGEAVKIDPGSTGTSFKIDDDTLLKIGNTVKN